MAVEKITLNLIPTGETPTIHAAQFDKERAFQIELKEGEDDFSPTGYDIEIQVRKVDNNIVTAVPSQVSGNIVTFLTTEQMTACSGTNLAELQISKDNKSIATLHFYLVVQRDVLAGGLSSQSDIYNLEEQIEAIVPEVIGDKYYTAEQVDKKIAKIPTFDPTNYYDKTETNDLLSQKANTSSLSTVATSGSYDDLSDKPTIPGNATELPISASETMNTKEYIDDKTTLVQSASGSLVHITDGADNIPVKSLVSQIVAVQSGSGTPSPSNPRAISGFDSGVITVTDNDQVTNNYTFAFGQTVYGGHFDNKGNLVVTHKFITLDGKQPISFANWKPRANSTGWIYPYNLTKNKVFIDRVKPNLISNCLETETYHSLFNDDISGIGCYMDTQLGLIVRTNDTTLTNATAINAYLTNNPIQVCYELANPITLSITSQDIPTLLGENNIYSNCGDVEVEYFTSSADGIADLIRALM